MKAETEAVRGAGLSEGRSLSCRRTGRHRTGILLALVLLCILLLPVPSQAASFSASLTASYQAGTKRTWKQMPNGRYIYATSSGTRTYGFLNIGKRWYYFNRQGYLASGWFKLGSYTYHAAETGTPGTTLGELGGGYTLIKGTYYVFNSTQKMGTYGRWKSGWVKYDGRTFYYNPTTRKKASGFTKISSKYYYFAPTSDAKTTGALKTGWQTINGKKYYFRTSGKTGVVGSAYTSATVKIGSKYYTFGADGALKSSSSPKSGSSSSSSSSTSGSSSSSSGTSKSTEAATEAAVRASGKNSRFIEYIGTLARADMKKTGVLASITVAQAILESNYGKSTLAVYAHNLFGMKASSGKPSYRVRTAEYINGRKIYVYASFRKYSTWAESVADHSNHLLTSRKGSGLRYKGLKGEKNYKKAAQIIKNGGYATAPTYVSALCSVIRRYNLTRFDK